jgi:thiol-disulfide isomerase/thioredoxin
MRREDMGHQAMGHQAGNNRQLCVSNPSRIPIRRVWPAGAVLCLCLAQAPIVAQEQTPIPAQAAPADVATPAAAQTASAPLPASAATATPAKSPADLYRDAMQPLDEVRKSLSNWSDAELGALGTGMHMANQDCAQGKPELYKGDDLYNFARLCAFGQDWEGANAAALAYIASHEEEHRAQAYAISVSALVHMKAYDLAVQTAREMMARLPYDAEVAYALRDLKDSLEQASDPAVLPLAGEEHDRIVAALAQGVPLKAVHGIAVLPVGALYESAMQLAFLNRYEGDNLAAAAAAAAVQSALPATAALTSEDRQRIDAATTRYRLLGMHIPDVKILRALESPAARTRIDLNSAAATVLVLFPDWCGECRGMMKTLTKFAEVNRETQIRAYGLVFADDSVVYGQDAHEENLKKLAGTQTLVVPDAAVETFGADDYPLGIVLDSSRRIRFIGTLPADAFNGDGYVSKVIMNMAKNAHGAPRPDAKGN